MPQSSENDAQPLTRVGVFGLGYVGCVSAACFAKLGYSVIAIDRDIHKIDSVRTGRSPFYEPGLEDLVRTAVDSGKLRVTTEVSEAVANSDVAFLCVGTPSERNGNLSLEQIERVAAE